MLSSRFWSILVLAGVLAVSSVCEAKDLCVTFVEGGYPIVFRKVKKLKPGGAIALNGFAVIGGSQFVGGGNAAMDAAGTVQVFIHLSTLPFGGSNTTFGWTGDATLAGSGFAENEAPPDGTPDGTVTMTALDCATVTIP